MLAQLHVLFWTGYLSQLLQVLVTSASVAILIIVAVTHLSCFIAFKILVGGDEFTGIFSWKLLSH